jgi:hypothetical protein
MGKIMTKSLMVIMMVAFFAALPQIHRGIALAQDTLKAPITSTSSVRSQGSAKKRRIIILGTTIVGSIARPRVVYEVPWKDPESLNTKLDEPQRDFHNEIFLLMDKDGFEAAPYQQPPQE